VIKKDKKYTKKTGNRRIKKEHHSIQKILKMREYFLLFYCHRRRKKEVLFSKKFNPICRSKRVFSE
jgi:hypothetical protein